jgi:hypothetical protein
MEESSANAILQHQREPSTFPEPDLVNHPTEKAVDFGFSVDSRRKAEVNKQAWKRKTAGRESTRSIFNFPLSTFPGKIAVLYSREITTK